MPAPSHLRSASARNERAAWLRGIAAARLPPEKPANTINAVSSADLLRSGGIAADVIVKVLADKRHRREALEDILLSRKGGQRRQVLAALARHWGLRAVDLGRDVPDVRLIDRLGARFCLRNGAVPVRDLGGAVLVAVSHPRHITRLRPSLVARFGRVVFCLALREEIAATIIKLRRLQLAREAETRVPLDESCRSFASHRAKLLLGFVGFCMAGLLLVAPLALVWGLTLWAIVTLALSNGLKIAAGLAVSLTPRPQAVRSPERPSDALPVVSVIVALYRESNIAARLVRRLSKIDYPAEKLDIVIAVEEDDALTRIALDAAELPSWMRVLTVPEGQLKTKPRALNFALDGCRGEIIGVYDAEDAPDPDQIRKVVARFAARGPQVVCLQGVLDFYNPTTNWLSRCFTIEYAVWFRMILPGLQRLGMPLPLGGTTLFFRRKALEYLGGWDAHNVTEDADLGMRLARHGLRTEMIETVTYEEANCRPLAWVKQRSRWIKGYMMTWIVHMRDPVLLYKQLGARQFLGFQILFLCTLSQFLLAPFLWSFWVVPFGGAHPVADALPGPVAVAVMGLFVLTEVLNVTFGILAMRKTRHRFSRLWIPSLHFYFPLAAIASYKALWETLVKPFYWDKTTHGEFDS